MAAVHFQEFVTESLGTVFAVEVVPALGEARNPLWFELCPCRDDKFVVRRRVDSVDKFEYRTSWSTSTTGPPDGTRLSTPPKLSQPSGVALSESDVERDRPVVVVPASE